MMADLQLGSEDCGASAPLRVLLIEDCDSDAQLVAAYLDRTGDGFVVERVETLKAGMSLLREGEIDAVLLDLHLPDSDGWHTFDRLHAAFPELPVVVLSGLTEAQLAAAVGASASTPDFLPKDKVDSRALQRAVKYVIEQHRRQRAEEQLQQTRAEFNAARVIQERLLPQAAPVLPNFDIAGACMPTEATGGDYFDYLPMIDGRWGVLVADVSSHGFAPALIMASTRQVLHTLTKFYSRADDLLNETNCRLHEDTGSDHFVTLFLAMLDPAGGPMWYAGAGHEGYVIHDSQPNPMTLSSTGLPLGIQCDTSIERHQAEALQPGDMLLLMTDGFEESRSPSEKFFGKEAALSVVAENRHRPAAEIIEALFSAVRDFCWPGSPQDDLTAVIVKRLDS